MSICSHCLQGMCRKHPLQDHGERQNELKKKLSTTTSLTNVNDLLKAQIERLQSQNKGTHMKDAEEFRSQLDQERAQILTSSKSKKSKSSSDNLAAGLNPSVARLMQNNYGSEEETETKSASRKRSHRATDEDESSSSSSSSSDEEGEEDSDNDSNSEHSSKEKKKKSKKRKKRKRKHKKEKKSHKKSKKRKREKNN